MQPAAAFNVRGTPCFFINGRRLAGARPYEVFEQLVVEQRIPADELTRAGAPRNSFCAKLTENARPAPNVARSR
jgi:hypothetical protein